MTLMNQAQYGWLVCWLALGLPLAGHADEITPTRLQQLPAAERESWMAYALRSQQLAQADEAALAAEVKANGLKAALKAPSGGDFKLPAKVGDAWFGSDEALKLAKIILSYQAPNGGWSKHLAFSEGVRRPGTQWTSQSEPGKSPHYQSTFDNRSTTEEIIFLAEVWKATGNQECAAGVVRGVEFVLASQFPNGGWPQVYPLEGGYHDNTTLNDDAMTHVLELCYDIKSDAPAYKFLPDKLRQQVRTALERGIQCVMAMQIRVNGKAVGWCAQHDPLTLQPTAARKMEPIALSGVESARLIKFLMSVDDQTPQLIASIEGCLEWLEQSKITNVRKTKIDGKTTYINDPTSTELYWARFYDLKTLKAIFPGRNGIVYDSFQAMAQENRLGYDYYSTLPDSIVGNAQKKWRKQINRQR